MKRARLFVIAVLVAGVTAVSALPAAAQPQQDGLVNVNLNDIQIGVPIAVAANICDLDVNVLAEQRRLGNTACDVTADAGTTFGPSQGGGSPRQEGLVNVNVSDVTVLVPVAVAANACDVAVNVLAQQREAGQVTCTAISQSEGQA
jgi:hypothetical protein